MSNRKGKREREAGRRKKRGLVPSLTGAEWTTLKLGRKKMGRYFAYRLFSKDDKMAIPVVESRKPDSAKPYESPSNEA